MIATRILLSSAPAVRSALQSSTLSRISAVPRQTLFKSINSGQWRGTASRAGARQSLKEPLVGPAVYRPATETPSVVGKLSVAAASGVGIGALCFYGLRFGKEAGAIDRMGVWPEHVKARVRDTYMYFGGALGLTAASAAAFFRSPTIMKLLTPKSFGHGMALLAGCLAVGIGLLIAIHSTEYRPGFGTKQLAWMAFSGLEGAILAPLMSLGGPLIITAATYTAGIVGGLSAVAMCAPSDQFLYWGGPLGMGLGVVCVACLGSLFLPPTTALGASLYSVSVYGGLVLFGGFVLYDTQKIVKSAENHPGDGGSNRKLQDTDSASNPKLQQPTAETKVYHVKAYDPVIQSMCIYLDALNIFIRIAMILESRKK